MEELQIESELLRHAYALLLQLTMRLEEDPVRDAIVAELLLLPSDDDRRLRRLRVVT